MYGEYVDCDEPIKSSLVLEKDDLYDVLTSLKTDFNLDMEYEAYGGTTVRTIRQLFDVDMIDKLTFNGTAKHKIDEMKEYAMNLRESKQELLKDHQGEEASNGGGGFHGGNGPGDATDFDQMEVPHIFESYLYGEDDDCDEPSKSSLVLEKDELYDVLTSLALETDPIIGPFLQRFVMLPSHYTVGGLFSRC